MAAFVCNVCGASNAFLSENELDREKPSCRCGSNVRFRWIIHQLSTSLFGRSYPLPDFPVAKQFRGIGFSDSPIYAAPLTEKFNFVNTRFDAEPFFDITDPSCGDPGALDFIIASEVFEHLGPPVQPGFDNLYRLLKPGGFVLFSTPWKPEGQTKEHYPDLHDWAVVKLRSEFLVVNRTRTGKLEIFDQPCFHGGPGQTLEMRLFSQSALKVHFHEAGFSSIQFTSAPVPEFGIVFPQPWSLPCLVTKLGRSRT